MVFSFFSVTLLFISSISSLFLLRIYIFLIPLAIYFCMLYTLSFRALGILIMLLSLLFSHSVMFNSFVTPWTVAHQASLSIGFPREEYWSGLPISEACSSNSPHMFPALRLGLKVQRRALDTEQEELGVRKLARCMS